MLNIENLHYAYRGRPVLSGVNLHIERGTLLTLLGRNGAGKSTLLNCIAGLLKPQQGRVLLDGQNVQAMRPRQIARLVGYVSQAAPQTYRYSVLDYVVLGRAARLGLAAKPKDEDYAAAMQALETLNIAHLAGHIYMETSGGEKQLANIAKVLVQQPELILFDEPTSALDYGNAVQTLRLVADLSERGYTIIMTTHNPEHPLLLHGRLPHSQTAILGRDGTLQAGNTADILNNERLEQLYGVGLRLLDMPDWPRRVCAVAQL